MPEFDLDNLFTHHPPKGDQCQRYAEIREAAKAFAGVVVICCPPSADKAAAITKIREAMMSANAAIACNE